MSHGNQQILLFFTMLNDNVENSSNYYDSIVHIPKSIEIIIIFLIDLRDLDCKAFEHEHSLLVYL